jgi:membrane-bound serine protease (ClpP class)
MKYCLQLFWMLLAHKGGRLMKNSLLIKFRAFFMITAIMAGAVFLAAPADAQTAENESGPKIVYIIPVEQTIETGLQKFLTRAFNEAEEAGADHIILEINTFGGRVDAAIGIGELIRNSPIPTVAYIKGKAISAGSYISLNAHQIVMAPGSSIGAAALVTVSGERVEDSKTIATWVGMMTAAAEMRGRNAQYAAGMVDDQMVVEVKEIGKTFGKGELITFTYQEAVRAGYAEATAENEREVLALINAENSRVVRVEMTPAESLARFLTHPFVSTLLLLIGICGVVIELFVPGFGIPGILGVAGFVLYFFGHYAAGFAGVEHILLFAAGIVLLILEIFVPSFGIFGILGILSLLAAVILAAYDTGNALMSLLVAGLVSLVIILIFVKYFKHRGIWNKFILRDQLTREAGYSSSQPKEDLLGKEGVSVTPLRPSGTAMIGDERVDVVTSGEFIEKNKAVVVIKIEGNRIVVREK